MKLKKQMYVMMLLLAGCSGGSGNNYSVTPGPDPADPADPVDPVTEMPAATAPGTPIGAPVSAVIGSSGGEVSSGDQGIRISIPAGALAEDTTISIQEVSNEAHGGIGRAYRISPEGLQSSLPMTIALRYDDAMMAGTAPVFASIAYQDSAGHWRVHPAPALDVAGQQLSVPTHHFSDWSVVAGVQLEPRALTLATSAQRELQVKRCEPVEVLPDDDELVVPLLYHCDIAPLESLSAGHWAVNGLEGGSSVVGTIVANTDRASGKATYTAPETVPAANPVAVSVQIMDIDDTSAQTTLVSNITIVKALSCEGLRDVDAFSADLSVDPFNWHASSDDQAYEGHQQGRVTSSLRNTIPPALRAQVPVGIWSSMNQPHGGYVSVNDTHWHYYPDETVVENAQGAGLPYVGDDLPGLVTLSVDFASCEYTLAATFAVAGTITVNGVGTNGLMAAGGLLVREQFSVDEGESGSLQREASLPVRYDNDEKLTGFYPAGQNDVLRASGQAQAHWSFAVE